MKRRIEKAIIVALDLLLRADGDILEIDINEGTISNLPPQLAVSISVHKCVSGQQIGKISIVVSRDRWNGIAGLNNAVEADNQLIEAAGSATGGNWETESLNRMLRQGFEEIKREIKNYENNGTEFTGEHSLLSFF